MPSTELPPAVDEHDGDVDGQFSNDPAVEELELPPGVEEARVQTQDLREILRMLSSNEQALDQRMMQDNDTRVQTRDQLEQIKHVLEAIQLRQLRDDEIHQSMRGVDEARVQTQDLKEILRMLSSNEQALDQRMMQTRVQTQDQLEQIKHVLEAIQLRQLRDDEIHQSIIGELVDVHQKLDELQTANVVQKMQMADVLLLLSSPCTCPAHPEPPPMLAPGPPTLAPGLPAAQHWWCRRAQPAQPAQAVQPAAQPEHGVSSALPSPAPPHGARPDTLEFAQLRALEAAEDMAAAAAAAAATFSAATRKPPTPLVVQPGQPPPLQPARTPFLSVAPVYSVQEAQLVEQAARAAATAAGWAVAAPPLAPLAPPGWAVAAPPPAAEPWFMVRRGPDNARFCALCWSAWFKFVRLSFHLLYLDVFLFFTGSTASPAAPMK
jgi:hypothetical protein